MGYIKKGSVASLVMGGISGILAAIGAYVSSQPQSELTSSSSPRIPAMSACP